MQIRTVSKKLSYGADVVKDNSHVVKRGGRKNGIWKILYDEDESFFKRIQTIKVGGYIHNNGFVTFCFFS
ncbi:hypothetical protein DWY11_15820 [Segatella copri]|uniref:Uncharacterized protein n=1 Tax=Segatella copri TaxID=165179 RepID=A0A3R5WDJ4_9BACT|nr:hypothetical protein DWY11_15820 [Segatella copri]